MRAIVTAHAATAPATSTSVVRLRATVYSVILFTMPSFSSSSTSTWQRA